MPFESDWAFLRTALPDLQEYILSSDLYYPLRASGGVRIPQLTLGNLLLSQTRLMALSLDEQRTAELASISQRINDIRSEWRTNWGIKAGREFGSRLNLWQQYIRELRSDPRQQANYYATEVRNRAILRLLRPELTEPVPNDEEDLQAMLDQILRGLTKPGPFVWEPELAGGFPAEGFWFLYVTL